jgi:4-carboxymuconolactone decarboxylase
MHRRTEERSVVHELNGSPALVSGRPGQGRARRVGGGGENGRVRGAHPVGAERSAAQHCVFVSDIRIEGADQGVQIMSGLRGEVPPSPHVEPGEVWLDAAVEDYGYGQVWSSGRLDLKSRMLLTVGVLAATGRTAELRAHLNAALDGGIGAEELAEAFLHVSLYAGFPAALDGTRELRRVLERR